MSKRFECANCGKRWREDQLNEVRDLSMRVGPGELMPAGECPDKDCGAVCHEVVVRKEKLVPYRVHIFNASGTDVWDAVVMMSDRKAQEMRERLVKAEARGLVPEGWFVDTPTSPYTVRDLEDFLDRIKVYR
jgi:hypothetical protein